MKRAKGNVENENDCSLFGKIQICIYAVSSIMYEYVCINDVYYNKRAPTVRSFTYYKHL